MKNLASAKKAEVFSLAYTVAMLHFFIRLMRWRLGLTDAAEQPRPVASPYIPRYAQPSLDRIHAPDPARIQITWIGHATFLIQVGGKNILTDPIWSERASPLSFLGPKRHARPGLAWSDLPTIDIVLISHTHYDHLDRPTVKKLGDTPQYVIPKNMTQWFQSLGITRSTELDWWQSEKSVPLTITSLPANHWSKRDLWRKSDAGWGGYMIESDAGTIYFAGDTGSHPSYFKDIAARFPRIDVGLIPIGAYYPQWIFGRFHVNPREAVAMHREIGARQSIGMHWGVFKLTEEPLDEPPILFYEESKRAGLAESECTVMHIGETRTIS